MRHFGKAWRYGKFLLAGVAVGGGVAVTGIAVVHASRSYSPNGMPSASFDPKWDYNWDKREPYSMVKTKPKRSKRNATESEQENSLADEMEKVKSKTCRHLIFIRHGEYEKGDCDEQRFLTARGREQAAYAGKRLATLGIKYTTMISSCMSRARETADIILENMNQPDLKISNRDPLLNEGAPIVPDPPSSSVWDPSPHQFYEDGARIEAAFRKYFYRADPEQTEDSYEIIVAHANVIRYFTCRALQFPSEGWLRMSIHHTGMTFFTITPSGRVILRAFGDSGHLPPKIMT